MWFDPSQNLFGEPLAVWVAVALVWLGPFAFLALLRRHLDRRDRRAGARSDPPT